ncbi:alpha-protein kinase 3-like [Conger conger]|uniref:alpha-protein kinase 3-like n=1 Tax=Conger conger TaxID=82655 RepID=UPI002A5A6966|nr:alpha-protein kinase 3-like [Conger conger]XP_061102564.1 alpha-protein kinase 3-like [Conger conger]
MSSRRPMTRAFSANGRLGGISEDDLPVPTGRPDSRNYLLNVRPENRSTLCSVMAQLTEETQPSFDTTLKSRAVSEDSNVKFSCEVSGYPVPELTWYKDDMQMDRYCGLPKYEIFRSGKVHTLHIYNCTIEDAAIYQASARNNKGIVSCSGVLEVGLMNEFKIHQQFFNKLKHKADTKRKEIEESRRRERGKENVQATVPQQQHTISPERPPRKRRSPSVPGIQAPSALRDKEPEPKTRSQADARLHERARGDVFGQPAAAVEIPNGFPADARVTPISDLTKGAENTNDNPDLAYVYETVEIVTTTSRRPTKEPLAMKRPKIANGVAGREVSGGSEQGKGTSQRNEGEVGGSKRDEVEEGGMSLAQYLAESLKSQEYENKQNSEQDTMEVDVVVSPEKDKDKEKAVRTEPPKEVNSDTHTPASKQPEPPHSQGPLSSVFFSIRDMFFGSKNNEVSKTADDVPQHNHVATAEKEPPSVPLQPDSKVPVPELGGQTEDFKTSAGELTPMDTEEQVEPPSGGAGVRSASPQHITREVWDDAAKGKQLGLDSHGRGATVSKSPAPVVEEPVEMAGVAAHLLHKPSGGQMQAGEASGAVETAQLPTGPLVSEVGEDHMQAEWNVPSVVQDIVAPLCEPDIQVPGVFTSAGGQATTDTGEKYTLHGHDQTDPGEPTSSVQPDSRGSGDISMETKAGQQKLGPKNMGGQDGNRDAVKEGDKQVTKNRAESGDGHGKVNLSAMVEDNVEMKGKESPPSTAQKLEAETISDMQEKWETDGTEKLATVKPLTVELKLSDVSQLEEPMAGVPEVNIPQPRIPEVLDTVIPHLKSPNLECVVPELPQQEATVINIPKTHILESPTERKPVDERSGSQLPPTKALDIAIVESDQASIVENIQEKQVLLTHQVSQQDKEKPVPKERRKKIQRNLDKTEKEIPVINVCLSEDSEIWFDPEPHKVKYPTVVEPAVEEPFKVPTFVVSPITLTSADSLPESINMTIDEVKKIESIPSSVHVVNDDVDLTKKYKSPSLEDKEDLSPPASVCEKITDVKAPDMPLIIGVPSEGIALNQSDTIDLSTRVSDTVVRKTPPLTTCFEEDLGKSQKELQTVTEPQTFVDQLQKDKSATEKLSLAGPEQPMLSPTTLRRFAAKGFSSLDVPGLMANNVMAVPAIQVDDFPSGEKQADEGTGGDSPPAVPSCETSPRLRRKDSPTLIPSATPQELASGARRKIFVSKSSEGAEKEELPRKKSLPQEQEQPYMSPSQSRKSAFLQTPTGQQTPPTERRSPLIGRKKATLEVPKRPEEVVEETDATKTDVKPAEKETLDPFKAPQVIRKIRGEPFPDALGHLKLWCQFFNVLSDSTIKWYRDEVEIVEVKRSAGDESQVALAIVQTSSRDCGVYGCTIKNEYGTDTTDFLLSADILSNFLLREDLEVGEEIEMTPMVFTKGLADPGCWGDKFFGRIMIEEAHIGEGCVHKACRVKVIYGLEPVFESGSTCIIKVRNPIAYSSKDESSLAERNLEITKQECKIQNTAREYCKVFAAEARTIENFGTPLEMLPRYLMYRPANTIPYATVETNAPGLFQKYCMMDATGRLIMRSSSEVEQKCCAFQHWIHQWTSGNLLVTQLEGVGMRITNIAVATKSKGYQGLPDCWNPQVFEQFVLLHQCNYYCGLLGLRTLKPIDPLSQPAKIKASRSPLLNRRAGPSSSPQLPKKGVHSPQSTRKAGSSPKVPRKGESGDNGKAKAGEAPKA